MADSTSPIQQIVAGASAATNLNENFDAASPALLYGRNAATTTGLTWGYVGGRYGSTSIASGTVTLTTNTTNYVVAAASTGTVSTSTATTNWNDTANYIRLYLVVTNASNVVTSYQDHRTTINVPAGASVGLPGFAFAIDISSTADADPGAGLLRFNNATQASATVLFIDNQTSDAVSMTTLYASLPQTGFITLSSASDPTKWRNYKITAVTSATGYYKFTVVSQAGNVAFANGDSIRVLIDADANTGGFTGGTLTSALNEAPAATIASASTVNIGAAAANTVSITGTTTITAFDSIADGAVRRLVFAGALTLTHNGTSLILPGSANITTAAGDSADFLSLGSGNWRCVKYHRANGTPISAGGIAQNSQSTAYTLVLTDANKHILHPSADTTARTFTIPANSSVAFEIGTAVTFVNQNAAGVVTIAITTDTMRLAGAGTTGSRTLAANGIATALKITSTEWIISGTSLT